MYQFCRCPWSEFIDPVFEVLSERYTAARFLLVDAYKCKVYQLLVLGYDNIVAVSDENLLLHRCAFFEVIADFDKLSFH